LEEETPHDIRDETGRNCALILFQVMGKRRFDSYTVFHFSCVRGRQTDNQFEKGDMFFGQCGTSSFLRSTTPCNLKILGPRRELSGLSVGGTEGGEKMLGINGAAQSTLEI